MNKKEKVSYIIETLDKIYPNIKPFLNYHDNYTLLIAVLLSAQARDVMVNKVTPILFSRANNPFAMSKLTIPIIQKIIKPCGLSPNKAKNIYNLSKILINEYGGKIPQKLEELEKLPGVGHKTASVVLAMGFNIPTFPVDTHIHRMMYRWGLSNGSNVKQTEKDAKRLFPKKKWIKLHLQIIAYAREYSPSKAWDLDKDIITKNIASNYLLSKVYQNKAK